MPPWVMGDSFTILGFAGSIVTPHHPPMGWEIPRGLLQAAPITPNRLVAGLVCPPASRRSKRSWEAMEIDQGSDQSLAGPDFL